MVMVTVVMIDGDDDDAPFPGQHGDDLGHSGHSGQVVMVDVDDDADDGNDGNHLLGSSR